MNTDVQIKNDKIVFQCNHCESILKAPKEISGKQGICPYCDKKVVIPVITEDTDNN
jgi:DNA-directed RNA polymerase subunit RPC12/RpoP